MARLESESKGGFYPTPVEEMEHIIKRIVPEQEGEPIHFIDPCCGEGNAAKQFGDSIPEAITHGIELEKSRANKAESKLNHVLKCGYEEARMSHQAFSVMYLNPPFAQVKGERLEVKFLRDLTQDYLAPGGILALNIPQYVLRDVAKILANRFVDLKVWRFTDENNNYNHFKQVVVFGKRRQKGLRSSKEREYQQSIEKELYNLSFLGKDALPALDTSVAPNERYVALVAPKPLQTFESMRVELDDIKKVSDDAFSKAETMFSDLLPNNDRVNIRPAMPLKDTHLAAAIASGALPETMGNHLLVGVTKRVSEHREEFNEKSQKQQQITKTKPKTIVRVFTNDGIYNLK